VSRFFSKILDNIVPSRKRAASSLDTSNRLEAFLRAIPFEYCGWSNTGLQAISSGFRPLFDMTSAKSLEDLQDALNPGDAAALETLYENLTEHGRDFELTTHVEATGKIIKLVGRRGTLSDASHLFHVIWAFDVTSFVAQVNETLKSIEEVEGREHEFSQTLNTLPMPIWVHNQDFEIIWVNKRYAQILGETSASIIAEQKELPITAQNKTESRKQRMMAQRALVQNRPQIQSGFLVVDGKRTKVDIHEIPNAQNVIGCAIDVSRIDELESEMRHFKSSNFEALEQLRTAIAIFDQDTSLAFYNAAYEELWGLDGHWLNKKPKITEILDKLRQKRKLPEQANFQQFKKTWVEHFTELIDPHEDMVVLPDGTMLRMVVVPQPRGGLLTTFEDVTSRYELETSYNTLVAVQQETLNNLAEGLAVIGEDGRIRLHNPAFAKLWDLNEDDFEPDMHASAVFDKVEALFKKDEWEERKTELVKSCFSREGMQGRITLKDGRIYSYRTVALPDGNVLVTYTNITNSVRIEHALKEKNAALQAAEKLKSDFLANVSYQLRTPLNAIMGFTEILNEEYFGPLNARQKGYTGNMIQAGHRLITLVDNVLDLSTIEAGYMTLSRESVDVKDAIESVAELTQDWARREGIEIEIKCPKNVGSLTADERRFKQVMLHLIRNAIDYTPPSGRIKITGKREKEAIKLTIADTGIGIPKEDLERIFQPFEKTKAGQSNRHSGVGLGLSLVKHIVELHGGSIEIQSEKDKGTEITCLYPLSANQNV